jgi:hypothetical protein
MENKMLNNTFIHGKCDKRGLAKITSGETSQFAPFTSFPD